MIATPTPQLKWLIDDLGVWDRVTSLQFFARSRAPPWTRMVAWVRDMLREDGVILNYIPTLREGQSGHPDRSDSEHRSAVRLQRELVLSASRLDGRT